MPLKRLLFLVALLAGCRERAEPPEPPDMSDLVAAYASQDGRLDPESAPALVEGIAESLREAEALRELAVAILEGLGDTGEPPDEEREDGLSSKRRALSAEGDAWARLTHRCGEADGTGEIVLRYVFDGGDPGDVIWGEAEDCLLRGSEAAHRLDGDVRVHAPGLDVERLLLAFDGAWARGESPAVELAVDLQLDFTAQRMFVRRRLDDGARFLVGLSFAEGDESPLLVHDRGGLWTCRLGAGARGGRCQRGDDEVTW